MRTQKAGVRRSSFPRKAGGFTLLELLVVLVILGLMVGVVAPRFFGQVGKLGVKSGHCPDPRSTSTGWTSAATPPPSMAWRR